MEMNLEEMKSAIRQALQSKNLDQAVSLSQSLRESYPDDAETNMLAGLALEQAGRIDEATAVLRRATVLDPANPETFHNLAVCLFNQGDLAEAATYAKEAIKLDPEHEQSLQLLVKCEGSKGEVNFEASATQVPATGASIRQGVDDRPNYVWGLGPQWTKIGYGLTFYCVLSFAYLVWHPFLLVNQEIRRDSGAVISFFLYVTAGLASLFWMLIDIIDRREKFVWLLPMWVCGISALPVLPLALYLAVGRKVVQFN